MQTMKKMTMMKSDDDAYDGVSHSFYESFFSFSWIQFQSHQLPQHPQTVPVSLRKGEDHLAIREKTPLETCENPLIHSQVYPYGHPKLVRHLNLIELPPPA
jgi:hypothetical protein